MKAPAFPCGEGECGSECARWSCWPTGAVEYTEFSDFSEALELRLQLESETSDTDIEIVTSTSESLEMLKQTHRRYFLNEIFCGVVAVVAEPSW